MPRVMMLGNLPLAGAYRPPPGRMVGLGSLADDCQDPGMALTLALSAGAGAGFSGATGDNSDAQLSRAVGGALQAFSGTLATQCQQALQRVQSGDPGAAEELQALIRLQQARDGGFEAGVTLAQQAGQQPPPQTDYTPWIIGAVGVAAVIGAVWVIKS